MIRICCKRHIRRGILTCTLIVCFTFTLLIFGLQLQVPNISNPPPLPPPPYNGTCPPEDKHDQFEPCLINYVKWKLLHPPSDLYNSIYKTPVHSKSITAIQEKLDFLEKHNFIGVGSSGPGFFIECGAHDGFLISPTLPLERNYNWTGLLVEANPDLFKRLMKMRRNAWAINVALCATSYSDNVYFYINGYSPLSGGLEEWDNGRVNPRINVNCVPLYSILAALDRTTVDYFSLDVEGSDLDILKTVPYDKVVFKVLVVEHAHVKGFQMAVVTFMEGKGYKFIGTLLDYYTQDSLFVHESVYTPDMALKIKFQKV